MSKNSYSKVGGENVRLLQALIDEAPSYTKPTNSRNANILKSIINNTEYNEPPQSEIEELLIALKAKIGGEIEVNELTVTENGSYDAGLNKAYNPVNVELPLDSKQITANGTYNASDDNLAGFSQVTVNVEGYKLKDIPNTPTAIATFSDGSDLPMPKLEVGIEPVQDLRGYDAPWVGGSGKNKANPSLLKNGYTNPSNKKYDDTTMAKTQFVKTQGLSTITISATNGNRCYVCYYNDIPNVGDEASTDVTQVATSLPQTITVDTTYTYIAIQVCYNASGANVSNVQVESGQTATTFAPYSNICPISGWDEVDVTVADDTTDPTTENVYTIDLDGTRYGGKVDLVSGVMTVDRAYVDLGTLNWSKYGDDKFYTSISDIKMPETSADRNKGMICSNYKPSSTLSVGDMEDGAYLKFNQAESFWIRDSRYTDATAFKTAMNGVQLVYELATPLTIQLPTTVVKSLRGVNNVFADSGDVISGKYFAEL